MNRSIRAEDACARPHSELRGSLDDALGGHTYEPECPGLRQAIPGGLEPPTYGLGNHNSPHAEDPDRKGQEQTKPDNASAWDDPSDSGQGDETDTSGQKLTP